MDEPLDNPIRAALGSHHRDLALDGAGIARYPAEVAPFLGIDAGALGAPDEAALARLLPAGDTVLLLGAGPALSPSWSLRWQADLAQMVAGEALPPAAEGDPIRRLGEAEHADVLGLTALVYPHYFRPQTMRLGRYFGIYRDGRLAAMIGERMRLPGWTEISAVCTHPDFVGQGLARRLFTWLARDLRATGTEPFLHVSTANTRAVQLYEQCGFVRRRLIPFWSLRSAAQ